MVEAARKSIGLGPAEPSAVAGPAETTRRCIVTGAVRHKAELLRFVVGPDGRVVPDVAGRLPGRGLWLSPSPNAVKTAGAKAAFARAARRAVSVPDDLDRQVEDLLARRLVDGLGLARRAGEAVAGFEKVRAFLRRGPVRVLFTAADATLNALAKRRGLLGGAPDSIDCLSGIELGAAFGRERTIYAAVRPGRLAGRLITDAARLAGFREDADWKSSRYD